MPTSQTVEVLQQVREAYPGAYIYTINIIASATIPGSAPANTVVPVSFSYSLGNINYSNVTTIVIPATQIWFVADMYTNAAPSVDGYVLFYKNGTKLLQQSPLLSSLNNQNPARSTIVPMVFEAQTTLNASFVTAAANSSTSAVTDEFFLSVVVVDFSFMSL